jgi:hypothetical protein
MATSDGYGQRLGERLRVENAPAIVTRALHKADMAVTEIRCDDPLPGMGRSIQREDAFLVGYCAIFPCTNIGKTASKRRCANCELVTWSFMN